MTEPMVRLSEIAMRYAQRTILDIDELAIEAGGCIIIGGANGSGKTTLLKILAGLLRPLHTRVELDGQHGDWRRMRRRLLALSVYLHQQPYMFDRTVTENIGYGLRIAGIAGQEAGDRLESALDWSGLEALRDQNARSLSGGERQRVALARARVLRPKLLLMDEPTANLDREAKARTYALIGELIADGVGVVLSSHETNRLEGLEARALTLRDGHFSAPEMT